LLVNTDSTGFKAHTGKFVLGVNSGSTSTITLPVATTNATAYPILFGKDTTKLLNNLGGNYSFTPTFPRSVGSNTGSPVFGTSSYYMSIQPADTFYANGNRGHYYSFYDTFYLYVPVTNTYSFGMSLGTSYNNSGVTVYTHSNSMTTLIYDSLGNFVNNYGFGQNEYQYTSVNYNVFLCRGTYKIINMGTEIYVATNNGLNYTANNYSWSCSGLSSPDYKNLNKVNGCIYTTAVAATDQMLNSTFSIPAGKKMLVSAWVKESCGDPANGISCKDYTYTHSQLQLTNTSTPVTLNPAGPIIDGW